MTNTFLKKTISYARRMCITRRQLKTYIPLLIAVFVFATITRDSWVIDQILKSRSHAACPVPGYQINNERHTAVLSIAVGNGISLDLAMCIPFAVAAWQRIGWSVTVLVVGDIQFWNTSSVLNLVKQTSEEIATDVRFMLTPVDTHAMIYAKLMRIYAVLSTSWLQPDDYVLICDTDLLPLNQSLYNDVYKEDVVTVMNINCCGEYRWGNKTFIYLPIAQASIGMTSKTWKSVMNINTVDKDTMTEFIDSWLDSDSNLGGKTPEEMSRFKRLDVRLHDRIISNQIYKAKAVKHKVIRTIGPDKDELQNPMDDIMSYSDARFELSTYTEASWKRMLQLAIKLYNQCVVDKLLNFRAQTRQTMQ